jgi:hypothetical protein
MGFELKEDKGGKVFNDEYCGQNQIFQNKNRTWENCN